MLAVNLTGAFLTLRAGLRQMRGREWGRLLVVSSITGLQGFPYVSAYTASKHGAVGLVRAVAQEVAGTGITANVLCPGYLATEMTDRTIDNIVATTGRVARRGGAGAGGHEPAGPADRTRRGVGRGAAPVRPRQRRRQRRGDRVHRGAHERCTDRDRPRRCRSDG